MPFFNADASKQSERAKNILHLQTPRSHFYTLNMFPTFKFPEISYYYLFHKDFLDKPQISLNFPHFGRSGKTVSRSFQMVKKVPLSLDEYTVFTCGRCTQAGHTTWPKIFMYNVGFGVAFFLPLVVIRYRPYFTVSASKHWLLGLFISQSALKSQNLGQC